jgi:thiamine biosynthesis lipoprotein
MVAVLAREDSARSEEILRAAEAELRHVEVRMSNWLEDSEVSRLCDADGGVELRLSKDLREVLRAARDAHEQTGGAFDVTCRPQLELWRRAARRDRFPTEAQVAKASAASGWKQLDLTTTGIVKSTGSASVDLGGIAKGYAIDKASLAMRRAGARGGLVDVGGDLACFGRQPDGQPWFVDIQDPRRSGAFARLRVADCAVATSGDYARFYEIDGKRYSQIIDPRSGRPAAAVHSVTVVAASAMVADVWATALSVLGEEGFPRLPEGVEALIIEGEPARHRFLCTPGFADLLESPLPRVLERWEPDALGES